MIRSRGMSWVCFVALVGTLCGITAANSSVYSGFLGCRFSRSVCQQDEECVDDRLFGNCQKWYREKDGYQYSLNKKQLEKLEEEIRRLVSDSYSWDSLYTQCVLANVLLAYRRQVEYDPYFCDTGGVGSIDGALTEDTLRLLEKYFEGYYNDFMNSQSERNLDSDEGDLDFLDSSPEDNALFQDSEFPEKKDEYVNIHKYQKAHKRDPLAPPIPSSFLSSSEGDQVESSESEGLDEEEIKFLQLLKSLNPSELSLLRDYLYDYLEEDLKKVDFGDFEDFSQIAGEEKPDSEGYQWLDDTADVLGAASEEEEPQQVQDLAPEPAEAEDEAEDEADDSINIDAGTDMASSPSSANEDLSFVTMTPEDAKTLGDLLEGKKEVSSLSDEEITRFSRYVNGMLGVLDKVEDKVEEVEDKVEDKSVERQVISEDKVKTARQPTVQREQTYAETLDSTHPLAHFEVEVPPSNKRADGSAGEDLDLPKDPHDHHFDDSMKPVPTQPKYSVVDANFCYLEVSPKTDDLEEGMSVVRHLETLLGADPKSFSQINVHHGQIDFRVPHSMNASVVATEAKAHSADLKNLTGYEVKNAGVGHDESKIPLTDNGPKYFVLTFVLCGVIAGAVLAVIAIYIVRRYTRSKEKLAKLATTSGDGQEASKDYQDLCRQRMQSKASEKPEPIHVAARVGSVSANEAAIRSPSSRSSTSSWSEEPVTSNMDISTGHIVLSYMEDHLKNKDRLDQEWEALCAYDAEPNSTSVASEASNMRKNRYSDVLPYDHSRVVLSTSTNVSGSDYINATTITDHDPRNPAYICTQGPLPHTVADFWQMVWEQGSVVIVHLTRLTENGVAMCHRYWPEEGSDLYHIYEVHLVSEHIWCEDYLVRSFYLKNLQTNETRTVTQFHFLTWPDLGVPTSAKALLDFRRKVNKSYRGRSCPIVVHCSDGVGRTGTYCLIDMVLNRMSKGAKEIDIAASLEHIRDQRMLMVKTKEQFEFALAAVAEEVHAILKALPQ